MNSQKFLLLGLFSILFQLSVWASRADTVSIYSKSMHKSSKCVIVLPASYQESTARFPVVYLLHGYSGNYADWITRVSTLQSEADRYQLILVCPDGNYSSWYIDSPVDPGSCYETYISREVPRYVDSAYRTRADRMFRAITGLSMGGQGALALAWKHPDFFGAAGSMSGVQDLAPWKNEYGLTAVLGDTTDNPLFDRYSVINLVNRMSDPLPSLIIDCGVDDPFIRTNRQLHEELLKMKVPHDYIERNGTHNWQYWGNAIGYQLLFFHRFFMRNDRKISTD